MKSRHPPCRRSVAVRRTGRGFVLIEALVALLIFSFGVLGIVGLQASMTKAQTQSKFRADAALLAQQAIGTMWSDTANLANYAPASCAGNARCSQWVARVATALPNGVGAVTFPTSPQEPVITISWTPPNEQQHTYTTTSAIAANAP